MGDSEQSSTVGSQIAMSSGDTTDWEDEREQEIDFVTLGMFIIGKFDMERKTPLKLPSAPQLHTRLLNPGD